MLEMIRRGLWESVMGLGCQMNLGRAAGRGLHSGGCKNHEWTRIDTNFAALTSGGQRGQAATKQVSRKGAKAQRKEDKVRLERIAVGTKLHAASAFFSAPLRLCVRFFDM
jgi:hypothetical protein